MRKPSDASVAREMREHPERNVVVVGLVDDQGQILLVRTRRLPQYWQPVGGGMEPGDKSPRDALARELREELSIEIPPESFEFKVAADYDFGRGRVFFYIARLDTTERLHFDPSEVIEWRWFTFKDALSLQMFPATRKFLHHLLRRNGSRDSGLSLSLSVPQRKRASVETFG